MKLVFKGLPKRLNLDAKDSIMHYFFFPYSFQLLLFFSVPVPLTPYPIQKGLFSQWSVNSPKTMNKTSINAGTFDWSSPQLHHSFSQDCGHELHSYLHHHVSHWLPESKRNPLQDYQKSDGVHLVAPSDPSSQIKIKSLSLVKCARRCRGNRKLPCRYGTEKKKHRSWLLAIVFFFIVSGMTTGNDLQACLMLCSVFVVWVCGSMFE